MRENVLPSQSGGTDSRKKKAIATLFSSSPPTQVGEEYVIDWVCVFMVFFYNKTSALWNSCKCDCTTFEAGSGKWLWRSTRTGLISNMSARLYMRHLLQAIYDSLFRMNILNNKISFDLASSTRILSECRDHLRRLLRVYFHLAYNLDHFECSPASSDPADSDQDSGEPTTPRSPTQSPRSSPRPAAGAKPVRSSIASTPVSGGLERVSGSQRRVSKDRKSASSKDVPLIVPAADLYEYLIEFCTILKVPMDEVSMMRSPLFGGPEGEASTK